MAGENQPSVEATIAGLTEVQGQITEIGVAAAALHEPLQTAPARLARIGELVTEAYQIATSLSEDSTHKFIPNLGLVRNAEDARGKGWQLLSGAQSPLANQVRTGLNELEYTTTAAIAGIGYDSRDGRELLNLIGHFANAQRAIAKLQENNFGTMSNNLAETQSLAAATNQDIETYKGVLGGPTQ